MHKNLLTLQKNNPKIELKETPNNYLVKKAWNDDSFVLLIDKAKRIPDFSEIYLLEEFNSILDKKKNAWEFIYAPEKKGSESISRSFDFNYQGQVFHCSFEKSSRYLKFFGESFRFHTPETKTSYRNLRLFKDYFSKDQQPDYVKEYFKDKIPYSFFISGDLDSIKNKVKFAKTLNFYLSYYDRASPIIQIFSTENVESKTKEPCYALFDVFPTTINARNLDVTMLDILSVAARTSDVRLQFIFYYQILEYAAYYYLESKDDEKLRQIIKRPDINHNADDYIKEIIEVLSDRFHIHKSNDKNRLEQVVKDFCSIKDLKIELQENQDLLAETIRFDGGLVIKPLFTDISAIESSKNGIINELITNLSKIRNVIVHLRESRENTVILPTERNDELIMPYLYLIRRVAEKVAIQFD